MRVVVEINQQHSACKGQAGGLGPYCPRRRALAL